MILTWFPLTPYVVKSLWRHRARTALTVSGAAVAMFVFCCVGSIQEGLSQLTSNEESQRSLIVFQENRFCPTSSRLPEDYARKIRQVPGVSSVMPVQVWTNNCRASLDVIVFHGIPPQQLQSARDLRLLSGNWSEYQSRRDAALVGKNVALRRGLALGDQFTVGEISVKVAGVFESTVAAEDNVIYTSLAFLQNTQGLNSTGMVTQLEVKLQSAAEPDAIASQIDAALKSGPVATTTRRKGAFQISTLSDLVDLIGFAHWLGYACVALVLSLVATTMLMAIQDRVKEHAVLQILGVRPARVFRLVLAESLLLCAGGGILGTAIGLILLSWGGLAIGAEGVTIAFRPSLQLCFYSIAISILIGIAAGIWPALHAARAQLVAAVRDG